jgi:hypothetical protein
MVSLSQTFSSLYFSYSFDKSFAVPKIPKQFFLTIVISKRNKWKINVWLNPVHEDTVFLALDEIYVIISL